MADNPSNSPPNETVDASPTENRPATPGSGQAGSGQARWIQRFSGLGGRTLLMVLVLIVATAVLQRLDYRVDVTPDGRFSIDQDLVALIEDLPEHLTITAVFSRRDSNASQLERNELIETQVQSITSLSLKLHYQFIDDVIDLPEMELLGRRLEQTPAPQSLYIQRDGRLPFRIPLTWQTRLTLQRDLGGAFVALREDRQEPVYVLQGHGELTLGGKDSCSALLKNLQFASFAPQTLTEPDLAKLGRIPTDGALLIAGPIHPLGPDTVRKLNEFLMNGGRTFIAADWRIPTDLALTLRRYGIFIGQGVPTGIEHLLSQQPGPPAEVVNSIHQALTGKGRGFQLLVLDPNQHLFQNSPLTQPLQNSGKQVLSPATTPIGTLELLTLTNSVDDAQAQVLRDAFPAPPLNAAQSPLWGMPIGSDAWLAAPNNLQPPGNLGDEDAEPIPLTLARAVEYPPHPRSVTADRGARIVIWGSRDALLDQHINDPRFGNSDFIVTMLGWLTERTGRTTIPQQQFRQYYIDASESTLYWISALLIALLPATCIGIAVAMWLERR